MLLPGKAAGHVCKQAASTLVRYLGGDLSLVDELAQIQLGQQELDDDHPARFFGQAVESQAAQVAESEAITNKKGARHPRGA